MIFGIDCASAGGVAKIDWQRVRAAGFAFAALRVTYSRSVDKVWLRERAKAKAAGLVILDWIFPILPSTKNPSPPSYASQMAAGAAALVDVLEEGVDCPPFIDVEFPGGGLRASHLDPKKVLATITAGTLQLRELVGVMPGEYSSGRVWHEDLGDQRAPELADCPLWLAGYPFSGGQPPIMEPSRVASACKAKGYPQVPRSLGDQGDWWFHQYQGNVIDCPGFGAGMVDLNRFNVTLRGDKGDRVLWVQRKLRMAEASGIFDAETETALRAFQAQRGLASDGIVGPRSFAALAWA